jgi:enoyl-CoA hydratase
MNDIHLERIGEVELLTLDRPNARNALTHETYAELEAAVRGCDARCLVITGADPAFCSGDDVKVVMKGGDGSAAAGLDRRPRLTPAADALLHTDVPVDLRVASERARFGELFVKRGLCCDVPGLARLASLVGRERAAELLFTGRLVEAEEALRLGLVSRVVPHEKLRDEAIALAARIAENPPLAVRRLKAGLRVALDPDFAELGRWVASSLAELFQTEDHREGVRAFLEKREPRYTGR